MGQAVPMSFSCVRYSVSRAPGSLNCFTWPDTTDREWCCQNRQHNVVPNKTSHNKRHPPLRSVIPLTISTHFLRWHVTQPPTLPLPSPRPIPPPHHSPPHPPTTPEKKLGQGVATSCSCVRRSASPGRFNCFTWPQTTSLHRAKRIWRCTCGIQLTCQAREGNGPGNLACALSLPGERSQSPSVIEKVTSWKGGFRVKINVENLWVEHEVCRRTVMQAVLFERKICLIFMIQCDGAWC